MKILVTGLAPTQCNTSRDRLKYRPVIDLYVEALRYAGHEVIHRAWAPGGDLSQFDVALVGLIPFNSINARHVYTICDVIGRARANGCGLLFMVDDWKFGAIHGSTTSLNKNTDRLFTSIKGRTNREWAEFGPGRPLIDSVMDAMANRRWPTTILPAYGWGDTSKFNAMAAIPTDRIVYLDPSPFQTYTFDPVPAEDRQRRWVLGTLSDQRGWISSLGLDWPVEYFGTKPSGAEGVMTEPALVQLTAESWGSMCPPYAHAGSGWWRCRYIYAADTGAVLLANPAEVAPLGDPYLVTPAEVEKMSVAQLTELASAQAATLRSHLWTREQLAETINELLASAVVEQPGIPVSNPYAPTGPVENLLPEEHPGGVLPPRRQPVRRESAQRDERRFDQTHLRPDKHGVRVHRDYAAHFFKWGFATRLVTPNTRVLDVGCGVDSPLANVMTMGPRYVPAEYLGVDLNKISKPFGAGWATIKDQFNFVDQHKELPQGYFDIAVCVEVIEHMGPEDGAALLSGIYDCLTDDGTLLISTPVFNGKAAVNHIHEYELEEMTTALKTAGFEVTERYGTFASYPDIKKVATAAELDVLDRIKSFYSDEVAACFLAPLYPEHSRNVMHVCKKMTTTTNEEV